MKAKSLDREVSLLALGELPDPHRILGPHPKRGVSIWRPGAPHLYLEVNGEQVEASCIDDRGLFCFEGPGLGPHDYRIFLNDGQLHHDPYAFGPTFGEMDEHLFGKGVHYDIYRVMGACVMEHQGVLGTAFTVWAPTAKRVSLVADFNNWDGRMHPMRRMGVSGVWELFVPGVGDGVKYKYEIKTASSEIKIKADPYGHQSELRPQNASIVCDTSNFEWADHDWIERRARKQRPINIYEVHLGSWKQRHNTWLNYRELAHELALYCKEMAFTHVELLPVTEHPLDESWGYQVSGYYAVTSRYGSPQDFQYFVNHLHDQGIGVIIDWVPAHFPTDEFSLAQFDGTCLYEHEDDRKGHHPHWDTKIFNYGRCEVSNFLIGSALYWLDQMHVDGLRVDAVASMLYLDYGRKVGEWIPNPHGGNENVEAIEFLKHLNSVVHERHPNALMIAEESTSFLGVTHPLDRGGLGFDLKWNMGWMNDTLRYFSKDPLFRQHHQSELTFGLLYAFSERFVLVLSHDEVVHGKKSLLSKMPGDSWQRFANLRLLYSYMICQPGHNLLFMGGEIGSYDEWDCKQTIPWELLEHEPHRGIHTLVRDLNHLYQTQPILWDREFEWVDHSDAKNSVISYWRKSSEGRLLCVHNFTPQTLDDYTISCGSIHGARELFSSDRAEYGGSGKEANPQLLRNQTGQVFGIQIQLAPLATVIFEVD